MRRLLTFRCDGAELGASLDIVGPGSTGLLFVTGGTQTRIGSHRLFERLAAALADAGTPCFRFDRRGVGDSGGEDPGWRGSGPDLAAAAAAFRAACPGLERLVGIGLCDGATALSLFGAQAGIDGLILLNPWLIEAAPGAPPAIAIKHHYQERLTSAEGWQKVLSGSVSWTKLLKGIRRITEGSDLGLADEIAAALAAAHLPFEAILATDDATGIAARYVLSSTSLAKLAAGPPILIESPAHTFSRAEDFSRLLAAIDEVLARIQSRQLTRN